MTALCSTGKPTGFIHKPQLDRLIAVPIQRLDLQNMAWPCLDNRDRDNPALLVEKLSHADLSA
jgi:hypothetical protein